VTLRDKVHWSAKLRKARFVKSILGIERSQLY